MVYVHRLAKEASPCDFSQAAVAALNEEGITSMTALRRVTNVELDRFLAKHVISSPWVTSISPEAKAERKAEATQDAKPEGKRRQPQA